MNLVGLPPAETQPLVFKHEGAIIPVGRSRVFGGSNFLYLPAKGGSYQFIGIQEIDPVIGGQGKGVIFLFGIVSERVLPFAVEQ